MAQRPRQFWRGSFVALAAVSLALPPALAAMTRSDHLRDLSLSETLLGQFTPASGDPRLIARYSAMSEEVRSNYSFTPAVNEESRTSRAITAVIRKGEDASTRTRPAAPARGRAARGDPQGRWQGRA